MSIKDFFKLKNILTYGFVLIGKNLSADVAFERDLGGEYSLSKRLIFVKDSLFQKKVIGYASMEDISGFENDRILTDGKALIDIVYKDGEKSTIQFKDQNYKLWFLEKKDSIFDSAEIIEKIENQ